MDKTEAVSAMDDCRCPEPWGEHCACVGRRRCVRRTGRGKGPRCSKAPVDGTTVCASHGAGKGSPVRAQADKAVVVAKAKAIAKRWNLEDVSAEEHPVKGLLREYRRTAAVVAYLDDLVGAEGFQDTYADKLDAARLAPEIEWWERERDRLAKRSVELLRAGVEERQVRIAETQAHDVVGAIQALLGSPELALTREQKQAATPLVRQLLRQVFNGDV